MKAQYNLAMAYLQKYGVDKEIEQLQKSHCSGPEVRGRLLLSG